MREELNLMTTDKGAPAPTTFEQATERAYQSAISFEMNSRVRDLARNMLTAAGVPALLARVAEVEGALAFYASPENYKPDWHGEEFAPVVRLDRGAKARAALAEKSSH